MKTTNSVSSANKAKGIFAVKANGKDKSKVKTLSGPVDYRVCKAAMEDKAEFDRLARWGREEIRIAEQEMPGLMALRQEFGKHSRVRVLRAVFT